MLPKQARGTFRKHITKPSEQVAAPPSRDVAFSPVQQVLVAPPAATAAAPPGPAPVELAIVLRPPVLPRPPVTPLPAPGPGTRGGPPGAPHRGSGGLSLLFGVF